MHSLSTVGHEHQFGSSHFLESGCRCQVWYFSQVRVLAKLASCPAELSNFCTESALSTSWTYYMLYRHAVRMQAWYSWVLAWCSTSGHTDSVFLQQMTKMSTTWLVGRIVKISQVGTFSKQVNHLMWLMNMEKCVRCWKSGKGKFARNKWMHQLGHLLGAATLKSQVSPHVTFGTRFTTQSCRCRMNWKKIFKEMSCRFMTSLDKGLLAQCTMVWSWMFWDSEHESIGQRKLESQHKPVAGEWRKYPVAIKTVVFQNSADESYTSVLASEAAIASNMVHRNVVTTYSHDIRNVRSEQLEQNVYKFYLLQVGSPQEFEASRND